MAIRFTEITASPIELSETLIQWRLDADDPAELVGVEFIVDRSGGLAGGPFQPVSGRLANVDMFVDRRTKRKNLFRHLIYRVRAGRADPVTGAFVPVTGSFPVDVNVEPDLLALEIVRQFRVLHRRVTGQLCGIFSIKDFGPRCGSCWNAVQKRNTNSNCKRCFGTGFHGGYFAQVNAFVDFNPTQESVQITQFGEWQRNDTLVWITNFPPVKPKDLIVDPLNRRWRVINRRPIDRLGFVVQQFLQLREIQRVDVEHCIPVSPLVPPDDVFHGHGRVGGSILC